MISLWSIIAKPRNRQILSWVGGGVAAVAGGIWVVVTYGWSSPGGIVKLLGRAQRGWETGRRLDHAARASPVTSCHVAKA